MRAICRELENDSPGPELSPHPPSFMLLPQSYPSYTDRYGLNLCCCCLAPIQRHKNESLLQSITIGVQRSLNKLKIVKPHFIHFMCADIDLRKRSALRR